jgi:hypothetical protein
VSGTWIGNLANIDLTPTREEDPIHNGSVSANLMLALVLQLTELSVTPGDRDGADVPRLSTRSCLASAHCLRYLPIRHTTGHSLSQRS